MRLSYKRDKKPNWPLMYLAGNYCDSDEGFSLPRYQTLLNHQSLSSRISSLFEPFVPLSLLSLWHSV